MTKRTCFALTLALFIGVVPSAIMQARAQNSAEKNTTGQTATPKPVIEKSAKEQSTAEKNPENNVMDAGVNFPQAQGAVELRPGANTRITLKLTDTSRVIYKPIGK